LVAGLAVIALPLLGSPSTWLTLNDGRPAMGDDHLSSPLPA